MTFREFGPAARATIFGAAFLLSCGLAFGQAAPGPLPPSHPLPPPPKAPPARKKPELEPRKSLAGYWKLNQDDSDDAKQKLEDARKTQAGNGGPGGGMGGPRVGVGFPCMGCGPNGPYGGGGPTRGDDTYDSERVWELIRPEYSQNITLSDGEVDSTNDHGDKVVYYTDGRKLQKSKDKNQDTSVQEVSAQWKDKQLVTDEKGPRNKKISRTFELSPDGKQFTETWTLETTRSGAPIHIRYVYDAAVEGQR